MRTILYLLALVWATIWHGGACVLGGLFRVPYRRGGYYDRHQTLWARMILKASGIPVRLEGAEHLDMDHAQIVVANHASFFDIMALLAWLPVAPKFVAKKELFSIPIFGQAIKAAGHVRIDRANRKEAFSAYDAATRQMHEHKLTVVVYPEGTRTLSGELLPFKKGPFVFAIESGTTVVPCYVGGAFGIQPKGSIRVRPRPLVIALGPPIPVAGLTLEDRDILLERARQAMLDMKSRVDATLPPA
jgi:1-acyl-sn-glycerol-3-phosphate acyltransferase